MSAKFVPNDGKQVVAQVAKAAVFAVIPLMALLLLIILYLQVPISSYVPHSAKQGWLGDIGLNWHQVATFRAAGWQGGYYTLLEQPAPAKFTHFFAWGPGYPVIYGLVAKILGWGFQSTPYYNVGFLYVALFGSALVCKPDNKQLLVFGVLIATLWPIHIMSGIPMQESLNQTYAILIGTLFAKALRTEKTSIPVLLLLGVMIFIASLTRGTWAVLWFAYFWLLSRKAPAIQRYAAVAVSAIVFAVNTALYFSITAPFPLNYMAHLISVIQSRTALTKGTIVVIWRVVSKHLLENITALSPFNGSPEYVLWFAFWVQMALIIAITVYRCGTIIIEKARDKTLVDHSDVELVVHIVNLVFPLIITMLLYDTNYWRGYRVLAPHLIVSLILLIAFKHYRLIYVMIVLNALVFPIFLTVYRTTMEPQFTRYDVDQIHVQQAEMTEVMPYTPNANAWCNTVLTSAHYFDDTLLSIPPGIGISWFFEEEPMLESIQQNGIKSKYVLLTISPENHDVDDLVLVKSTQIGYLYTNKGSECP